MRLLQFVKSRLFFKQIVIVVVAFLFVLFLLNWWLSVTTNHNQRIQVPHLQKIKLQEVQKKLRELNLNYIVIDSANYNPSYPKKSVIEQNPEAGDFVKEKRKIYLTLNPSKYRDVTIPDINGRTRRQATMFLRAIGFKVGDTALYVPDIGKDVVRGLQYKGNMLEIGERLPKNSTINLILGDGNAN